VSQPSIRSFVAVLLDEPTRTAVSALIDHLRPLSRAVGWVPAQNLHLTLKFLGNQSPERLEEVTEALRAAAAGQPPFTVTFHGVGAFPGIERPRILWVGLAHGAVEARTLQERVEQALEQRGVPREGRPWHPHLTVGRVFDDRRWRREASPSLRTALAQAAAREFGSLTVTHIALMRSDLSPAGARYSELCSLPLGA
jgi:2'-5' RNA ligase